MVGGARLATLQTRAGQGATMVLRCSQCKGARTKIKITVGKGNQCTSGQSHFIEALLGWLKNNIDDFVLTGHGHTHSNGMTQVVVYLDDPKLPQDFGSAGMEAQHEAAGDVPCGADGDAQHDADHVSAAEQVGLVHEGDGESEADMSSNDSSGGTNLSSLNDDAQQVEMAGLEHLLSVLKEAFQEHQKDAEKVKGPAQGVKDSLEGLDATRINDRITARLEDAYQIAEADYIAHTAEQMQREGG